MLLCRQVSELGTPIYLEMTIIKTDILKILVIDKTQENFLLRIMKFDFFVVLFSTSLPFKMIPVVYECFSVVFIKIDMDAKLLETKVGGQTRVLSVKFLTVRSPLSKLLHVKLSHYRSESIEHYILCVF
jgi:hypothetical protein